jgi:dTDP-4-amino-4,6-dideoxygalactose transaminase
MPNSLALLGGAPVRTQPFPKWPIYGVEEEHALTQTLRSGKWGKTEGQQVARFEKRFAEYCNTKHAIAVCNGTISLQVALLACGIKAGDEVIVPPYTFLATATAVVASNASPAFVDINRQTFNIDSEAIERAITPRTRAIIPVHFGGIPCDMDAIMAIAAGYNLTVIEDAAHAHGTEYKSRRAGSLGHMASFSFQSSKNLTCGEGGIITTSDDDLAQKCRSIHNCGRLPTGPWYEHHVMNGNYRLGEFQGAILNCQLDRLDPQTDTRDRNGQYLDDHLAQIPGISPQKRTIDTTRCAYHLYCFRLDEKSFGLPRTQFLEALSAEGIPCSPGYPIPLYRQPLFANRNFGPYDGARATQVSPLQNCEKICSAEGCWFTQDLLLGSQDDMNDIIAAIQKVYDHRVSLADSRRPVEAAR